MRKKLLKLIKTQKTDELRNRIKNINIEIKHHFQIKKSNSIRRKIIPGNTKSLWDAVKIAKDSNKPKLPVSMSYNNQNVNRN